MDHPRRDISFGELIYEIRPIHPLDEEREAAFIDRLSRHSAYQRLMSARRPTPDEIRRWTRVDGEREVALVAVTAIDRQLRQIGVARYGKGDATDSAEFAVVVEDEYQRCGVGRHLLAALIDAARQNPSLVSLEGSTLSDNAAMIALARQFGFTSSKVQGGGFITSLRLALR